MCSLNPTLRSRQDLCDGSKFSGVELQLEPESFPILCINLKTENLVCFVASVSVFKFNKKQELPCLVVSASESAVHSVSNLCDIMTAEILSIESVYSKTGAYHLIIHAT